MVSRWKCPIACSAKRLRENINPEEHFLYPRKQAVLKGTREQRVSFLCALWYLFQNLCYSLFLRLPTSPAKFGKATSNSSVLLSIRYSGKNAQRAPEVVSSMLRMGLSPPEPLLWCGDLSASGQSAGETLPFPHSPPTLLMSPQSDSSNHPSLKKWEKIF